MDKVAALSRSPLFEMLSNSELEDIASLSEVVRVDQGQVIFEEGELSNGLYVIVSGEIEIVHRDHLGEPNVLTSVLTDPEFFGEMSLIEKEYRSATTRARTSTRLLHLTAENLTAFRKHHPDGFTFVIINIARVLSARLREVNQKLSELQ